MWSHNVFICSVFFCQICFCKCFSSALGIFSLTLFFKLDFVQVYDFKKTCFNFLLLQWKLYLHCNFLWRIVKVNISLSNLTSLGCSEKGISQTWHSEKRWLNRDKRNVISREKWIAHSADAGGTAIHLTIIKVSECFSGGFELGSGITCTTNHSQRWFEKKLHNFQVPTYTANWIVRHIRFHRVLKYVRR